MSVREQHRTWVLTRVARGELTMAEAAGRLALSERQLWHLRAAFERDGPAGLVHRNRGRPSPRRIEASLRARVIELRRTRYVEVNDTHFGELLAEHEAITLSRECMRQMLRADGIASPRRRPGAAALDRSRGQLRGLTAADQAPLNRSRARRAAAMPPQEPLWIPSHVVSCVSCVSSVNSAETHETFHQESGMRYSHEIWGCGTYTRYGGAHGLLPQHVVARAVSPRSDRML
jgi:hypothetical protein